MMRTYEDGYKQAYKDYEEIRKYEDEERTLRRLGLYYAWNLVGFFYKNKKGERDYKVIITKYDKGYEQALKELQDGV